jgi:hypothetical protein
VLEELLAIQEEQYGTRHHTNVAATSRKLQVGDTKREKHFLEEALTILGNLTNHQSFGFWKSTFE